MVRKGGSAPQLLTTRGNKSKDVRKGASCSAGKAGKIFREGAPARIAGIAEEGKKQRGAG